MHSCNKNELEFCVFLIHQLAEQWKISPAKVYQMLTKTGALDQYILPSYDCLHTLGREYLVEDITGYVRDRGVEV